MHFKLKFMYIKKVAKNITNAPTKNNTTKKIIITLYL